MFSWKLPVLLFLGMILIASQRTMAGPPFVTDDPDPVEFKHWEVYLFGI
jgi:hypothetical protein